MNHSLTKITITCIALSLVMASCYPGKFVLAKWADGSPRVVRYYKRKDPLQKKVITYFKTAQVQSVEYFHHNKLLQGYLYKEWYLSGAKRVIRRDWYKDTVTTFNPADSNLTLKGYGKGESTWWFENGKPQLKEYNRKGIFVFEYNNAKGDSLVIVPIDTTRADGYKAFTVSTYIGK